MSNNACEIRPVRVLTDFRDPETEDCRFRIRRVITIDPKYAKDIYEGRINRIVGGRSYIEWYNGILPVFIYEKSPRKLITGMARLSPVIWLLIPEGGDPPVNDMKTVKLMNDSELKTGFYFIYHGVIEASLAYFHLRDGIPLELFKRQVGNASKIRAADITKTYRFETPYEPWMLGIEEKEIRLCRTHARDMSAYDGEPWHDKLKDEIREAVKTLKDDSDITWTELKYPEGMY